MGTSTSEFGQEVILVYFLVRVAPYPVVVGGRWQVLFVAVPQQVLEVPVPVSFIQGSLVRDFPEESHLILVLDALIPDPVLMGLGHVSSDLGGLGPLGCLALHFAFVQAFTVAFMFLEDFLLVLRLWFFFHKVLLNILLGLLLDLRGVGKELPFL